VPWAIAPARAPRRAARRRARGGLRPSARTAAPFPNHSRVEHAAPCLAFRRSLGREFTRLLGSDTRSRPLLPVTLTAQMAAMLRELPFNPGLSTGAFGQLLPVSVTVEFAGKGPLTPAPGIPRRRRVLRQLTSAARPSPYGQWRHAQCDRRSLAQEVLVNLRTIGDLYMDSFPLRCRPSYRIAL
jgi:hypothetical protein